MFGQKNGVHSVFCREEHRISLIGELNLKRAEIVISFRLIDSSLSGGLIMKAYRFVFPIMIVFLMGAVGDNSFAIEPVLKTWEGYEVSKLLGSDVQNKQGEHLGTIKDFMLDSMGHIEFAILLQSNSEAGEGRYVAVPFDALSHGPAHSFLLDITRERLTSAPSFEPKKAVGDSTYAEEVYRYFGLEPYWSDQGHEKWFRSDQDPFDLVG